MRYFVFDLERSMFWKANRRGYTSDYKEAGLYSYEEAKELVENDIMNNTKMVEEESLIETACKIASIK